MKIAIVNKYENIGGAAIAAKRLYLALKQQNIDTQYITQFGKNADIILANNFLKQKKDFIIYALSRALLLPKIKDKNNIFYFDDARFGHNINKIKAIKNADIVHLHWINFGFIKLKTIKKLLNSGKKIVWTFHDMWPITGGCFHSRGCNRYTNNCQDECPYLKKNKLAQKVFHIKKELLTHKNIYPIAISSWMHKLITQSPLINKKIPIIGNPIDTNFFKPMDKTAVVKELKIDPNKLYISFIAFNISNPAKGGEYLIKALKYIQQTENQLFKKIKIIAIGRQKQTDFFPKDLPIIYTGYINDVNLMKKYYAISDVFILPSLEESFSLVIQEALSMERPVVAFDAGGVSDMIKHQKTGYFAKYKDWKDLANGIVFMLKNKKQANQWSKNGRIWIKQNYDYPVITKKIINFYNYILSQ